MSENSSDHELDLLWGVRAIAAAINRTERQTFHMLEAGTMPGGKVGNRWVVDRRDLIAFFHQNRE